MTNQTALVPGEPVSALKLLRVHDTVGLVTIVSEMSVVIVFGHFLVLFGLSCLEVLHALKHIVLLDGDSFVLKSKEARSNSSWMSWSVPYLGWQPEESFDSGIESTVRWYLENEWWWGPLKARWPDVDMAANR